MPLEILTKLGVHTIRATGDNLAEAMEQIGFLASLPSECPVCAKGIRGEPGKQIPVSFYFSESQEGHTFYGLRCKALGNDAHETTFGRRKKEGKDGPFWYKGTWHKVGEYGKDDKPESRQAQRNSPEDEFGDE